MVDKLVQFEVLTCLMKAEIIEKPGTSFDRVRELLSMLPRQGPQAYTLFCKALEECGEIQALTMLGLETPSDKFPRSHLDLGGEVFVTAKSWNNLLNIHIRTYDVYSSGRSYPTRRGIVLTLKHWLEIPGVKLSGKEEIEPMFT
ncbi:uncharacterized protein LOC124279231 [Haliotis rubra]|uniref:uncharacterized protein LOC124279231 n=1 Tax=Haliotis rubra TaxID=36100 RepID=UPI001EE5618E|nr:uncharacterized protein LOC124279231 [Haliotis rubra]